MTVTRNLVRDLVHGLTRDLTDDWFGTPAAPPPDEYVANMNFAESRNLFYAAATN